MENAGYAETYLRTIISCKSIAALYPVFGPKYTNFHVKIKLKNRILIDWMIDESIEWLIEWEWVTARLSDLFLYWLTDRERGFVRKIWVKNHGHEHTSFIPRSKTLEASKDLNTTAGIDAFRNMWTKNIRHYGLLNFPVHDDLVTGSAVVYNYDLLLSR